MEDKVVAAELLERWRQAERHRGSLTRDSREYDSAESECEELADEYRRFIESRLRNARDSKRR